MIREKPSWITEITTAQIERSHADVMRVLHEKWAFRKVPIKDFTKELTASLVENDAILTELSQK